MIVVGVGKLQAAYEYGVEVMLSESERNRITDHWLVVDHWLASVHLVAKATGKEHAGRPKRSCGGAAADTNHCCKLIFHTA